MKNRFIKLGAIAVALIVVAVVLCAAASGSIFFVNQKLTPDDSVFLEEDGFAFHFYSDSKAVKVGTAFHSVGDVEDNLAPILFQMIPHEGYQLDSLRLSIKLLQPASALLLENPETGSLPPYDYTRTDFDNEIVLDFKNLDAQPSETVSLDLWLDMAAIDPATPEQLLLDISFTVHEDSILKIVKYNGSITIQLEVPFVT